MKLTINLAGVIALVMACAPALAAEGETKKRAKAKAPEVRAEPVELDKRVAESKYIFLGEGVRIYFLDRQYRETPYIRAADDGRMKSAVLVVKIVKPLQPAKGKQGIWFGDFTTLHSYGDPKSPRPLENPVTLFRSKSGTTPLPEKQLKEVVASINSKAEGARRKAEGSSAKPAAPVESEPKTAAAEGK
jgi:hypothetical protein